MRRFLPSKPGSRQMMVAVVLGALATTPTKAASASPNAATTNTKAVTDISRYCQSCWRNARLPADRWQDCTQEVFVRLLERVDKDKWGGVLVDDETAERREFLRAIDAVKKRTQRTRKYAEVTADVRDDHDRTESHLRDQREAVATAAEVVLSPRQRKIVEMSADGWAVPDIAAELKTTPERVSDEKYKAIRKLRTHLGVDG
jgi:RNA polymerase sigma factor (sigma-70 family)